MAPRELAVKYKQAGGDYLTALQKLGLDPDCLFWAEDKATENYVLVLVSPMVDLVGPLDLSRMLFRAYNLAATPKEIDPFVLRLHSPAQAIVGRLKNMVDLNIKFEGPQLDVPGTPPPVEIKYEVGGLSFSPEWIYKFRLRPRKSVDLTRQWHRFTRNVDRLAA